MTHLFIKVLEGVFLVGVAGCMITIPIAAWHYCSVIFERDKEPEEEEATTVEEKERVER